jgi:hypothetical protein
MKGLAFDRAHRIQTAAELAEPIDQVLEAVTRYATGRSGQL